MWMLSPRLGTLDAKARFANRTAKDGDEYSQLVFEAGEMEMDETEVNALFSSPTAYRAFKALFAACSSLEEVEIGSLKVEGAVVSVRLGAVSAQNGPEFQFQDCRIDKMALARIESETLKFRFRVTSKPALNGQFGELVSRLGHTAVIGLNAMSPNAQENLPLNSVGANEHGTSSIGSPEQERERIRERDREIAAQHDTVKSNGDKGKKKNGADPKVKREKVDTGKRRKASADATLN